MSETGVETGIAPGVTDVCNRCRTPYTDAQWFALPALPKGAVTFDLRAKEVHHHRNCPCGSSLMRSWCLLCGEEIVTMVHECGGAT